MEITPIGSTGLTVNAPSLNKSGGNKLTGEGGQLLHHNPRMRESSPLKWESDVLVRLCMSSTWEDRKYHAKRCQEPSPQTNKQTLLKHRVILAIYMSAVKARCNLNITSHVGIYPKNDSIKIQLRAFSTLPCVSEARKGEREEGKRTSSPFHQW